MTKLKENIKINHLDFHNKNTPPRQVFWIKVLLIKSQLKNEILI